MPPAQSSGAEGKEEAFMIDIITGIDRDILLFIQEYIRIPALNLPMIFITSLGNAGIFWIVVSLLMLVGKKTRKPGFLALCALFVGFLVTNLLLKNLVARVRPFDAFPAIQILVTRPLDYSFPSGHATSSFAAACIYFRYLDQKAPGIAALVLACLISLSRLYVGVHYPTDVICGVIIGILAAVLTSYLEGVFRKRKNRSA